MLYCIQNIPQQVYHPKRQYNISVVLFGTSWNLSIISNYTNQRDNLFSCFHGMFLRLLTNIFKFGNFILTDWFECFEKDISWNLAIFCDDAFDLLSILKSNGLFWLFWKMWYVPEIEMRFESSYLPQAQRVLHSEVNSWRQIWA